MWDVIGCGGRGVRDSGLAENWIFWDGGFVGVGGLRRGKIWDRQ